MVDGFKSGHFLIYKMMRKTQGNTTRIIVPESRGKGNASTLKERSQKRTGKVLKATRKKRLRKIRLCKTTKYKMTKTEPDFSGLSHNERSLINKVGSKSRKN